MAKKLTDSELRHRRWIRETNRKRKLKKAMLELFRGKKIEEVRVALSEMMNATGYLWKEGYEFFHASEPRLQHYL